MRVVKVRWRDAVAISSWRLFEAPPEPDEVQSVGYLVSDGPEHIIIATTISDGEYNAAIQILKVNLIGEPEIISGAETP